MIRTSVVGLIGQIDPDPPFQCVSAMCCCSDVLVVGDSHHVKVFDLKGNQISVLGQLYNDPCLMWTGLDLYVGEKRSTLWHCYQPKSAQGLELSRQYERVFRYVYNFHVSSFGNLQHRSCIACDVLVSHSSTLTSPTPFLLQSTGESHSGRGTGKLVRRRRRRKLMQKYVESGGMLKSIWTINVPCMSQIHLHLLAGSLKHVHAQLPV